MRARSRSRLMFTEPGPDAFVKPLPIVEAPLPDRNHCIHGGVMMGDFAICHVCHPEYDEGQLFAMALLDLCQNEAGRLRVYRKDFDDAAMSAWIVLFQNKEKIMRANNWGAMARRIAKNTILKLGRNPNRLALVSPIAEAHNANSKLDALALPRSTGAPQRAMVIPGVRLPATEENFAVVQWALERARRVVSRQDWILVENRLGLHGVPISWETLARVTKQTPRQAQYQFQQALRKMKASILRSISKVD